MSRERAWVGRSTAPSTRILTTFVANIPFHLDVHGLRGIFAVAGEIREVSIPSNQKSRSKYGFVRFADEIGVENSIRLLHSKVVRGSRLVVQKARSERRERSRLRGPTENERFRMSNHSMGAVRLGVQNPLVRRPQRDFFEEKEENLGLRVVKGVVNEKNFQWLFKCLIGECDDFCDLVKEVEGLIRVKKLQWNQYILQFESSHLANQALNTSEVIKESFPIIRNWSWYDVCKERPVWLEVLGVPPLGWKTQNFSQITGKWGNFVCLEKDLDEIRCFESIKVLIITKEMRRIDEHIHFNLEDKIFDVHVRESSSWSVLDDMSWLVAKPAITPISVEDHLEASPSVPQPIQTQVLSELNPNNFESNNIEVNRVQNIVEGENSNLSLDAASSSWEEVIASKPSSINTRVEETPVQEQQNKIARIIDTISLEGVNRKSALETEEALDISAEITRGLVKRGKKLEAKKKKSGPKIGKANRFYESTRRVGGSSKKVVVSSSDNTTDSIKEKARRAVDFGNRVGLKAKKNEGGAVKRITNALKEHRKDFES